MSQITPQQTLIAVILFFTLCVSYVLWDVTHSPFMDIVFSASSEEASATRNDLGAKDNLGIVVVRAENNPELEGKTVTHLQTTDGSQVLLSKQLLQREMTFTHYTLFDQFLLNQKLVATQLEKAAQQTDPDRRTVALVTDEGETHTIPITALRPISSLPYFFWFCIIQSAAALLFTAGVAAYQRHSLPAKLMLFNGTSYLVIMMTVATYRTRELAIDGEYFRTLLAINSTGLVFFSFSIIWLLMRYPTQFGSARIVLGILALHLFIASNHYFHWVELPVSATETPKLLILVIGLAVIGKQWQSSQQNPITKSIFSWLLFALMLAIMAYLLLYVVPALIFESPLVPSWVVGFGVLAIYVGLALGMFRVKLFAVEHIWFDLWMWLLGGASIVIVDVALMSLLSLDQWNATALALFIVGWLYFPLRQKLWKKLYPQAEDKIAQQLPSLLAQLTTCNSDQDYLEAIETQLNQLFSPESITRIPFMANSSNQPIDEMQLLVDWPNLGTRYLLKGKERGRLLFSPKDQSMANSLLELGDKAWTAQQEKNQSAQKERDRIARDLHDDVSAPLLMLIHKAQTDSYKSLAQKALSSVRDAIYALDDKNDCYLEDLLWDMKVEALERLEPIGIDLDWEVQLNNKKINSDSDIQANTMVSARFKINVQRIAREAVSNVIKHADASQMSILIQFSQNQISMKFINNGLKQEASLDTLTLGKGVNNMAKRSEELGGKMLYDLQKSKDAFIIHSQLPLHIELSNNLEQGSAKAAKKPESEVTPA